MSYLEEFPSHYVDPREKNKEKWCKAFAKTYHRKFLNIGPTMFKNRVNDYKTWRRYARGEQSINQYKQSLGIKNDHGKENQSWRNVDWAILPIAPRIKKVLQYKIFDSPHELNIQAIDRTALEERETYKRKLMENVINKQLIEQLNSMYSQLALQPDGSMDPTVPQPSNMEEVEMHMNMFYKDRYSSELTDAVGVVLNNNDWTQKSEEVLDDLIECGVAATRPYIDSDGTIKIRRCIPERMGAWGGRYSDFRDSEAIWEYWEMTVSEFRHLTRDIFTEDQIAEMVSRQTKRDYSDYLDYHDEYHRYPYDSVTITVMDVVWKSTDTLIYQIGQNRMGNRVISRKPLKWYDGTKRSKSEVVVNEIENIYRCMWVVETDFAFNYGLATDMEREASSPTSARLPYNMYQLENSVIKEMVPVLDQIQLNWLQYQNHMAKSKPAGLEVEMSAFDDIAMSKGGKKMDPKEVIAMAYETGNIVWRRKDWSMREQGWKPISQAEAWLPEGAVFHLNLIIQLIEYLRMITGLNEVVDSTTPNPRIGKAVSEIAAQSTNNALGQLYHAYDMLYANTAKQIGNLIPTAINLVDIRGIVRQVGQASYRYFKNTNFTYRDLAVSIESQPSDEKKEKVQELLKVAVEKQEIGTDDALRVMEEDNPYKAAAILKMKVRQNKQEAAQAAQQQQQMLIESQTASNQQAQQGKMMEIQAQAEAEVAKEAQLSQIREREAQAQWMRDMIMEKMKLGADLTKQENDMIKSVTVQKQKSTSDIIKTKILADARDTQTIAANAKRN